MTESQEIKSILAESGLDPSMNLNTVRAGLHAAGYSDSDTELIITRVIADKDKQKSLGGLQKVFRSDQKFTAKEINDYLGISVDMKEPGAKRREQVGDNMTYKLIAITIVSFFVGVGGLLFFMYLYKVGVFHPEMGVALLNGS